MIVDLHKVAKATKYPAEAFVFVQQGLDFAVRRIHGELDPSKPYTSRHISGQQLCLGLRDFAIQEYGVLARTVLKRWHIRSCEDFGRIVFVMIEAGLMQKTDEDSLEDFADVFNFAQAFSPEAALREPQITC